MSEPQVEIMLAVNDPDNGNFTGKIEKVEFIIRAKDWTPAALELDNQFWPPATVVFKPPFKKHKRTYVKIGRRKYPIDGYGTWVGNWCWNVVVVSPYWAAKIANYLMEMKVDDEYKWAVESGWTELFEKWQRRELFTEEDFKETRE